MTGSGPRGTSKKPLDASFRRARRKLAVRADDAGFVQCPHTLKREDARSCTQCLGLEPTQRLVPVAPPPPPEAHPSNPRKRQGC